MLFANGPDCDVAFVVFFYLPLNPPCNLLAVFFLTVVACLPHPQPTPSSALPLRLIFRFRSTNLDCAFHLFTFSAPPVSLEQVMAGGPSAMEEMQKDPETAELLQKLERAMGGIMP